jgi:hypothetical protein
METESKTRTYCVKRCTGDEVGAYGDEDRLESVHG